MSTPISPAPVTAYGPDYLPAYVSNGTVGLRVREIPLLSGVAVVNGTAAVHPVARVESTPCVPYPLAGDLRLNRVALGTMPGLAHLVEQRYDFACGELHSRFVFAIDGVEAQLEVLTFCSRTRPALVLQEIRLEVSRACDVELSVGVDPAGVIGRQAARLTALPDDGDGMVDGALRWEPLGALSTCGIAYSSAWIGAEAEQAKNEEAHGPLRTTYAVRAHAGRRYCLRQIAALVPSLSHRQPELQAARLVADGQALGWEALRQQNRDAWAELWRGRVRLLGADHRWQALADAAFFYLHSSVHRSSAASTHIFGLAQWHDYHYYYGHVMWDLEAFAVPPLLLTQPEAARAMLDYRSRSLPAARANARLNGYAGLQFPWESSPTFGEEAAPGTATAAAYEQHVSLGVALAFAQYSHATGDEQFRREQAWPVLSGVAEWLASRVVQTTRGYEIRRSMGIAERHQPADNVAYVNMQARVVLGEAIACAAALGEHAPAAWTAIAQQLVLPLNERTHVLLDHDGYRPNEEKGATPSALAGLFPVGHPVSRPIEEATIRYYLARADDYLGSPMLSALYGVWAARTRRPRAVGPLVRGGLRQICQRAVPEHA